MVHSIFLNFFSDCFDTGGPMIPCLVPEMWPWDGFCDGRVAAGIGYSGISWYDMKQMLPKNRNYYDFFTKFISDKQAEFKRKIPFPK